jgi:membrane-associated phospholipid phosphatase
MAEWKIKVVLGGLISLAFWAGYFWVGRTHFFPVTEMPDSMIDRWVPFEPDAMFFYLSQFFTMPLVLWLMSSRRQLMACCLGLALLIGVSFAVYFFWPTCISRPPSNIGQHPLYDLIVSHDLSGNACPSLHAGFGMFIAGSAGDVFRSWPHRRWLIGSVWLWTGCVLISTLLVKQHVIFDLLPGGLLGLICWWITRPKSLATEGRL